MNTKHKFSRPYSDFSEDPGDCPQPWGLGTTGLWWAFTHTDIKPFDS